MSSPHSLQTQHVIFVLISSFPWAGSAPPDLCCATSETATDVANTYISNPATVFNTYRPTNGIYRTQPAKEASAERLQYIDVYMDDLNCVAQGGPAQQHRVAELVLCAIKETYPSTHDKQKGSVSLKKALAGDRDWNQTKEILGWFINTASGTLQQSNKRLTDIKQLLSIPPTQ